MQYQSELPPGPQPTPVAAEIVQRRIHPLLLVGLLASLGAFALLTLPDLLSGSPRAQGGHRCGCPRQGGAAPAAKPGPSPTYLRSTR